MSFRKIAKDILSLDSKYLYCLHIRYLRVKTGAVSIRPKNIRTQQGQTEKYRETGLVGNHGTGNNNHKRKFEQPGSNFVDEKRDELDELAHTITLFGSKVTSFEAERKNTTEMLRLNSFIRAKTIEQKYFKKPKSPTLLTFRCRQQIHHLHQTDPETWSPDSLADCLPISEESIKKVLKSRLYLDGSGAARRILEHDLEVKKNWEKIFSSLISMSESDESLDEETAKVLENIGKEDNLFNIFYVREPGKEMPMQVSILPRRKKLGIFGSIVKDEVEKQEMKERFIFSKHAEQLEKLRKTLSNIKKILLDSRPKEKDSKRTRDNFTSKSYSTDHNQFEKSYRNHNDPREVGIIRKRDNKSYTLDDGSIFDENGEFLYRIP